MIYICNSLGYYIGFSGDNYELKEDEIKAPFPPTQDQFLSARWDGKEYVEGAAKEEIIQFNDIQRSEKIKAAYEQRKIDGWEAYQDFRADMVKEIYDGVITKDQAIVIKTYLSQGYDEISQFGDYETAMYKLMQIVLPAEHMFAHAYLLKAKGIMLNYIRNNYKPM